MPSIISRVAGFFRVAASSLRLGFHQPGGRQLMPGESILRLLFPGADDIDWERMAGPRWKSGAVSPFISWARRKFPELVPVVTRRSDNAKTPGTHDELHPLVKLLRRPNPYYGYSTLVAGLLLSRIVCGNAYLFKVYNGLGELVQLWYIPHWMVTPKWDEKDPGAFIDYYQYTQTGTDGRPYTQKIDPSLVVHIRQGIDPENTRLGLSDLAALYREVGMLNEAVVYAASILRNFGIPGLLISPGPESEITEAGADQIKQKLADTTTGASRGKAVVVPSEVKVNVLGFSPDKLALDKFLDLPKERIAAAIGIPALALGLESAASYENLRQAREQAVEEWLLPTARDIADDIDFALRGDFKLADNERLEFDASALRELQPDRDALRRSLVIAAGGAYMTVDEARAADGMDPLPGGAGAKVREKQPSTPPPTTAPGSPPADPAGSA